MNHDQRCLDCGQYVPKDVLVCRTCAQKRIEQRRLIEQDRARRDKR